MANTVKVGKRPATFKPFPVKFELPDGGEGVINVTYKYRTKTEFGAFLDQLIASRQPAAEAPVTEPKEPFSWEKFYRENAEASADHLIDSIAEWDLEDKLSRSVLLQLGDECPACIAALMAAYGNACRDGRLGN